MMQASMAAFHHSSSSAVANQGYVSWADPTGSDLLALVQNYNWAAVLARVTTHPSEAKMLRSSDEEGGCTPLYVACENDAPAVVIQSLLKAWPEASMAVAGDESSSMTPLHVTCSSQRASVHVVRVLLELGRSEQLSIRDADGDLPLHTACRCGASIDIIKALVTANPSAVDQRDQEGLTPLLRLWVRCFVIAGGPQALEQAVASEAGLTGELGEVWKKTELLLKWSHCGAPPRETGSSQFSGILHAASAVECPRVVLKIASLLYPDELDRTDEDGRTPLMIAAQTPVFKDRDLTDGGYALLGDVVYGNESGDSNGPSDIDVDDQEQAQQPSVVEVLLQSAQESGRLVASVPDKRGNLPIHIALVSGKKWGSGIKQLLRAHPNALFAPHAPSGLYPFMLAAVGNHDDIDTVYGLLRHSPSLVEELLAKERREGATAAAARP